MATYQQQISRLQYLREQREKDEAERKDAKLSPDQVAHWRLVLTNAGVPFAMSMPVEMVQRFRDGIQARINAEFPQSAAPNAKGE